jgi:predicted acyl esterase
MASSWWGDPEMPGGDASASTEEVIIEPDVVARMRDGTQLRADVYRPARSERLPTLLTRTPYGKHVLVERMLDGLDPVAAALADGPAAPEVPRRYRRQSHRGHAEVTDIRRACRRLPRNRGPRRSG